MEETRQQTASYGMRYTSETLALLFLAPVGRNDARATVFRPL